MLEGATVEVYMKKIDNITSQLSSMNAGVDNTRFVH